MALHPEFPSSPYDVLRPEHRWFPAAEELRGTAEDKLIPPLVARIRQEVQTWREADYAGASPTSRALLMWWFETDHQTEHADGTSSQFRYYFAQREAVETVIWLYDVKAARDKFDLMRFDATGNVSAKLFDEDWPRYVVKMATGAGKTKVLSLLMAWSYFHRLYETGSKLARNFLLIAPNIIVLNRLLTDFDGLRIFFNDPLLPDNGHAGFNWRDDFQIALHVQDDVRVVRPTGNLFLTNIHRVYLGEVVQPSLDDDDLTDYFLSPFGAQPSGKTNDSKTDLGEIVREIDELAVFNDEAHHIHDNKLAWFQSIQDIHHKMLQKDLRLALQIDVTATPRHNNGAIFVQTVSDYPLVEAIHQNVVKHPVLPDPASRDKLHVNETTPIITEKYADYLQLGVEEWRNANKLNAMLAVIEGAQPENEIQAMLAVQMAMVHPVALTTLRRADRAETLTQVDSAGNFAVKLLRTFAALAETLARLQRGGEHVVKVVHVHPGGQAIVGDIHNNAGGGGSNENGNQPHAKDQPPALGAPTGEKMPRIDAERQAMPITVGRGESPMPDARRR